MNFDFLPPTRRQREERSLGTRNVSGAHVPCGDRHPIPRLDQSITRCSKVCNHFTGWPRGTVKNLCCTACISTGVLLHDLVTQHGFDTSSMTIGIAGHMGNHVTNRPVRKQLRLCR